MAPFSWTLEPDEYVAFRWEAVRADFVREQALRLPLRLLMVSGAVVLAGLFLGWAAGPLVAVVVSIGWAVGTVAGAKRAWVESFRALAAARPSVLGPFEMQIDGDAWIVRSPHSESRVRRAAFAVTHTHAGLRFSHRGRLVWTVPRRALPPDLPGEPADTGPWPLPEGWTRFATSAAATVAVHRFAWTVQRDAYLTPAWALLAVAVPSALGAAQAWAFGTPVERVLSAWPPLVGVGLFAWERAWPLLLPLYVRTFVPRAPDGRPVACREGVGGLSYADGNVVTVVGAEAITSRVEQDGFRLFVVDGMHVYAVPAANR